MTLVWVFFICLLALGLVVALTAIAAWLDRQPKVTTSEPAWPWIQPNKPQGFTRFERPLVVVPRPPLHALPPGANIRTLPTDSSPTASDSAGRCTPWCIVCDRNTIDEMKVHINPKDLRVWVHTWWRRDGVRDATIASLRASDVRDRFTVERQDERTKAVDFYIETLSRLCEEHRWILRLEDDTLVNRWLMYNVCTWDVPHREEDFGIGFLSVTDPVMADTAHLGEGKATGCPYREYPEMHFGGGMLFQASSLKPRLERIRQTMLDHKPAQTSFSCSPSRVFYEDGLKTYLHVPSLVMVDLTIPCSKLGRVYRQNSIDAFGTQPFDEDWKRP